MPIIVIKPGMGGLVPKTSSIILFLGKEATQESKRDFRLGSEMNNLNTEVTDKPFCIMNTFLPPQVFVHSSSHIITLHVVPFTSQFLPVTDKNKRSGGTTSPPASIQFL